MRIVRPRLWVDIDEPIAHERKNKAEHGGKWFLHNNVRNVNQKICQIVKENQDKEFWQIFYGEDIQNLIDKIQREYPQVAFVWKMSTKSDVWYGILPYYLTIS